MDGAQLSSCAVTETQSEYVADVMLAADTSAQQYQHVIICEGIHTHVFSRENLTHEFGRVMAIYARLRLARSFSYGSTCS